MGNGLEDNLERWDNVNSVASKVMNVLRNMPSRATKPTINSLETAANFVLGPWYGSGIHGTYDSFVSIGSGLAKAAKKLAFYGRNGAAASRDAYESAYSEFMESMIYFAKLKRHELIRFIKMLEGYSSNEAEERDKGIAHFKKAARYVRGKGHKVRFTLPPNDGQVIGRFVYNGKEVGSFIWGELGKCVNLSNDAHWRLVHPLENLGYSVSRLPELNL